MAMGISQKTIKHLPDQSGVYWFKRGREILYIGKATSLRDRVRSYFRSEVVTSRGGRINQMLVLATSLGCRVTDSVLEALILESQLIKEHQPKYNIKAKDDKSFWFAVVTKEVWPRVLLVRGQDLTQGSTLRKSKGRTFPISDIFGPFPNASELRGALKVVRKIFPFRDACWPHSGLPDGKAGKPCFNYQLGLCPGVCTGAISRSDYRQIIRQIKLLFLGKKKALIQGLRKLMNQAARRHDFEQAARWRNKVFALRHLADVSMIKRREEEEEEEISRRIEAYDIAHLSGGGAVGVMVVAANGELKKRDYRKFKVSHGADDLTNLREVLRRRLAHHEWPAPDLIVVDGGLNQLSAARGVLAATRPIPVVAVVKDARHRPARIIGAPVLIRRQRDLILRLNQEAHRFAIAYHRHRFNILSLTTTF